MVFFFISMETTQCTLLDASKSTASIEIREAKTQRNFIYTADYISEKCI